jgi:transcriptional regulator with XRE-family HTH domain
LRTKSKKTDVARRLRTFREAAALTQEALGQRADIQAKYISEIENGHANPSIAVLSQLIERGLGIPLATFFTPSDASDDLAKLVALFAGQPVATRKRALRVLRALIDD